MNLLHCVGRATLLVSVVQVRFDQRNYFIRCLIWDEADRKLSHDLLWDHGLGSGLTEGALYAYDKNGVKQTVDRKASETFKTSNISNNQ